MLDLLRCAEAVVHRHEFSIGEEEARKRSDLFGDRGGKEMRLTFFRKVGSDFAHIGPESEGKHFIGFVQHQGADVPEVHASVPQVVEDAAWSADDDVNPGFQGIDLFRVARAPINGKDEDATMPAQGGQLHGDLVGQLPGRQHHQGLDPSHGSVDPLDEGNSESTGFPAARLGLDDEVSATAHERNRFGLDRGGRMPAEFTDGGLDIFGDFGEKFRKFRKFSHIGAVA